MTYDLEYDSGYDVYRYGDRLFVCAKALRSVFPEAGEEVTLALCDSKPGVKMTINGFGLDVGPQTFAAFYPRFTEEMKVLARREPYYVRMV